MTYVVLARKWRPQSFEELTGQGHVARTLQNAIQTGRIPHAILLTGTRGVGKTTSARIIAMALNCAQGPTPTPCGVCQACIEAKTGNNVDIREIDAATNRGINDIRELRDSVQYAPSRDRYKVYIIDEVHMLTNEAFNALLKTLEEPPPHVVFIFATTEPQKLPDTILSRCQRFDFRKIPAPVLIERMAHILEVEGVTAEPAALELVAMRAAGSMRDALTALDQVISSSDGNLTAERTAEVLGTAERRKLFQLSDAVTRRDTAQALLSLQEVLSSGTDVSQFAHEFARHLRDLTVLSVAGPASKLTVLADSELESAIAQIQRTDSTALEAILDIMIQSAEEIARSSMGEMRFELAIIRMCEIATRHSIDYLIGLLERHAGIETELPPAPSSSRMSSAQAVEQSDARSIASPTPEDVAPAPSNEGKSSASSVVRSPAIQAAASTTPSLAEAPPSHTDLAIPAPPEAAANVDAQDAVPQGGPTNSALQDVASQNAAPDVVHTPSITAAAQASSSATATATAADDSATSAAALVEPVNAPVLIDANAEEGAVPPIEETFFEAQDGNEETLEPTDSEGWDEPEEWYEDAANTPVLTSQESTATLSGEVRDTLITPTLSTWRQAVNSLDDSLSFDRRLLAMGHCVAADGVFRVAVSGAYIRESTVTSRARLQEAFDGISEAIFGRRWTLELVDDTSFSESERAEAWRIRRQEEEEEEALRAQIQQRLEDDPRIQLIKSRWPDYVLRREHIDFKLDHGSIHASGESES